MVRSSQRGGVLAIVQAGGAGSRMDVLTRERAKPALPFAGHYQLIDFALSSLAASGIDDVWLSVGYQASTLQRHVANGRPWDLDRTQGGLRWLVPEAGQAGPAFPDGNAEELLRRVDDIRGRAPEAVVVCSADSVYAADLRPALAEHRATGAACTVLTVEVSQDEARQKVVVVVDGEGRVTAVHPKPEDPPVTTVAAEIFLYDGAELVAALEEIRRHCTDADEGAGDFGDSLLPWLVEHRQVRTFPLPGYWRDLGTPAGYLAGHRDAVAGRVDALCHDGVPVLSRFPELPPARVRPGAVLEDALLTAGCDVAGTVRRSVLGPGVRVETGAVVEDSVIFAHVTVETGAVVSTSVVDTGCVIGGGARVGALAGDDVGDDAVTLLGRDCRVPPGETVAAGARLEPGSTV